MTNIFVIGKGDGLGKKSTNSQKNTFVFVAAREDARKRVPGTFPELHLLVV